MQVSLSLFVAIILTVPTVAIGENAFGSIFRIAAATNAPSPSSSDSSIVAAVITITENAEGNTVFKPETTNITQGAEIFIGNNSSSPQSITSGTGPEDPLSGKLFDTGVIKSKGYSEFVTANLSPGTYPMHSSTDPSVKGSIVVQK
jgi:plastocyanin